MNAYIGKQLNLSHCKVIVFSEKVAFEGIEKQIYSLVNNVQIRPSTNLVISKCDAYTYIDNSKPTLENLASKYYEIFPTSGKYTGYTYDATIGDFFNNLVSYNSEPYAILGGLSTLNSTSAYNNSEEETSNIKSNNTPISGKRGAENIGLAVFKNGYLIGELNAMETVCFSVIKNDVDSFLITIPDPQIKGNFLDIYIYPKVDAKANISIINGNPYIEFSSSFEGKIASMQANSDYLSNEILDLISDNVNNYLEAMFYSYLYKTSTEFESDINGFGRYSLNNFSTLQEFENYNWLSNYKNSIFKVKFKTKIQSGMLLTKT